MNQKEGFFDQLLKQQSGNISDDSAQNTSGQIRDEINLINNQMTEGADKSNDEDAPPPKVDEEKSSLPPEARRALVSLLRQGVIAASQKPKLFVFICRYQSEIRHHLSDMYLKLVLDEKTGLAFIGNIGAEDQNGDLDEEEEDSVSLITRRVLSLYDTLLLLVLRKHYQERETSGEQKVVIDVERIEANMTPFLPLTNNSKADRRKLNATMKKMKERKIIASLRGSEDRFEIMPIIRYVVKAEFLENLLAEYHRLAEEAGLSLGPQSNLESVAKGQVRNNETH